VGRRLHEDEQEQTDKGSRDRKFCGRALTYRFDISQLSAMNMDSAGNTARPVTAFQLQKRTG
jgi:hypothetical protein